MASWLRPMDRKPGSPPGGLSDERGSDQGLVLDVATAVNLADDVALAGSGPGRVQVGGLVDRPVGVPEEHPHHRHGS